MSLKDICQICDAKWFDEAQNAIHLQIRDFLQTLMSFSYENNSTDFLRNCLSINLKKSKYLKNFKVKMLISRLELYVDIRRNLISHHLVVIYNQIKRDNDVK